MKLSSAAIVGGALRVNSFHPLFQIVHRIMEAHANVRDMGLIEAKLAYIKGWQALPEFGVSYFVIKMANGKKEVGKSEVQNSQRGTFEIKYLYMITR